MRWSNGHLLRQPAWNSFARTEVEQVISALKALASAAAARVVELFPEAPVGEDLPRCGFASHLDCLKKGAGPDFLEPQPTWLLRGRRLGGQQLWSHSWCTFSEAIFDSVLEQTPWQQTRLTTPPEWELRACCSGEFNVKMAWWNYSGLSGQQSRRHVIWTIRKLWSQWIPEIYRNLWKSHLVTCKWLFEDKAEVKDDMLFARVHCSIIYYIFWWILEWSQGYKMNPNMSDGTRTNFSWARTASCQAENLWRFARQASNESGDGFPNHCWPRKFHPSFLGFFRWILGRFT